ncbi:MAG: hypothetical protein A2Z83_06420 [Omnitrophica bacterium GWA2_52_8]|nr:MAG: hypothetical protein A2Z83_06420 [Omnitrophica bacterium GWA2_52_8]
MRNEFRKITVLMLLSMLAGSGLFWGPRTASSQQLVSNEDLYAVIGGKAHNVMMDQRKRLRNILEGFLGGDWGRIKDSADQMMFDIDKIAVQYEAPAAKQNEQLQAMEKIREALGRLKNGSAKQDYEVSYQAFTAITFECVHCHQVRRRWGIFKEKGGPAPVAEEPVPDEPVVTVVEQAQTSEAPAEKSEPQPEAKSVFASQHFTEHPKDAVPWE